MGGIWSEIMLSSRQFLLSQSLLVGCLGAFSLGFPLPAFAQLDIQVRAVESAQAIVQLQGLQLPPPTVQGATLVPLTSPAKSNLLTVQGVVGQQPESFLVDTGASTTLLAKKLVSRLQLQGQRISGDRLASAVAGKDCPSMDANLHQLPSLSIGTMQAQNLGGLEFLNTEIPHGLSGVLGMNLLSRFDLRVKPQTQQLALTAPTSLPAQQRSQSVPLTRRLNVMLAQVSLNRRGPFTFLLDTGAASTFVSPQVAQLAGVTNLPRQDVFVRGFCGLEPAYRVKTPVLQLGAHQVQNADTIVLDSSVIQTLQVDGILGQNVFSQFEQHWRFPPTNQPDSTAQGSLVLTPLYSKTP